MLVEEEQAGAVFLPEQVTAMISAFEKCLERLKVEDRSSAMGFLVARTIIQLAKEGERDRNRLCESVIRLYRPTADSFESDV
jgi:hypothetical protein